jgi:hypothetical protein
MKKCFARDLVLIGTTVVAVKCIEKLQDREERIRLTAEANGWNYHPLGERLKDGIKNALYKAWNGLDELEKSFEDGPDPVHSMYGNLKPYGHDMSDDAFDEAYDDDDDMDFLEDDDELEDDEEDSDEDDSDEDDADYDFGTDDEEDDDLDSILKDIEESEECESESEGYESKSEGFESEAEYTNEDIADDFKEEGITFTGSEYSNPAPDTFKF